jgi:hypothetical protein
MKRTLRQILQLVLILVIVLSFPLIIEITKLNKTNAQITAKAANSEDSNNLVSLEDNNNDKGFDFSLVKKYGVYILVIMFGVSLIAFGKHKWSKT